MNFPAVPDPVVDPSSAEINLPLPEAARPGPNQTPLPGARPGVPADLAEHAAEDRPHIGATLGKYRLLQLIGRGTSSFVYRATHRKLPLLVALKVLRLGHVVHAVPLLNQLRSEAAILAHLNHPHIVRILDFEDEGPWPYLVTEYVPGCALSQMIRRHGRLPQDGGLQVLLRLTDALATALRLGVIHRDIKPDNILLTRQGDVKLADMGLATVIGAHTLSGVSVSRARAHLMGTAAYLAPEQARDPQSVDHRADIYGLGATLYHALCGRLPFEGRSCMEVIYRHLSDRPTPPHELAPDLDPAISELLLRMLAKDPSERFADYTELRAAVIAIRAKRPRLRDA